MEVGCLNDCVSGSGYGIVVVVVAVVLLLAGLGMTQCWTEMADSRHVIGSACGRWLLAMVSWALRWALRLRRRLASAVL